MHGEHGIPEDKSSSPDKSKFSLKNKAARWAATLMVLGAGSSVAANAAKDVSEQASGPELSRIEKLANNERVISNQNAEHIKNHSKSDVYIVQAGDGKDDVLYATGWVGEKHQYGNVEIDYSLDEIKEILQLIDGNKNIDFDNLQTGEDIHILVKKTVGEK